MRQKQIIYLDIDQVLFPLIETVLEKYNAKYNDTLSHENFSDYDISKYIKPECRHLFEEFANQDLFESMTPYSGAVEAVEYLNERYRIFYATAAHGYTIAYRDKMLEKWFPSFQSRQLIMIREKHLLVGDALVDDSYQNLINGNFKKFLMDFPWNRNFDEKAIGAKRIYGWDTGTLAVIDDVMERKLKMEVRN